METGWVQRGHETDQRREEREALVPAILPALPLRSLQHLTLTEPGSSSNWPLVCSLQPAIQSCKDDGDVERGLTSRAVGSSPSPWATRGCQEGSSAQESDGHRLPGKIPRLQTLPSSSERSSFLASGFWWLQAGGGISFPWLYLHMPQCSSLLFKLSNTVLPVSCFTFPKVI